MKKRRLQLEFDDESYKWLDELQVRIRAETKAELVRRALVLLDRVTQSTEKTGQESRASTTFVI